MLLYHVSYFSKSQDNLFGLLNVSFFISLYYESTSNIPWERMLLNSDNIVYPQMLEMLYNQPNNVHF